MQEQGYCNKSNVNRTITGGTCTDEDANRAAESLILFSANWAKKAMSSNMPDIEAIKVACALIFTNELSVEGQNVEQAESVIDVKKNQQSTSMQNDSEKEECFCGQKTSSNLIQCQNEHCKFKKMHAECIGRVVPPGNLIYCPMCRRFSKHNLDLSLD